MKKALCIGDFDGSERLRFIKKGYETVSIDLEPQNELVYQMTALDLDFKDNHFDLIYLSHMIEHIPVVDLRDMCAEITRVCKPKGRIEVITPVFNSSFWDDPTHIRPHNKWSIQSLFKGCKLIGNTTGIRNSYLFGLKKIKEHIFVLEKTGE